MCLLVYKQPGHTMATAHAYKAGQSNSDGFGIGWHDGTRFHVHRTMSLVEHVRALSDADAYPALVHYRMATHGATNVENVHPFLVGEPDDPNAFLVAHNGMFHGLPRDHERSDTRIMVENVLAHLRPGWADDRVLLGQLQHLFGGWNKVAVLLASGERVLFNEKDGHWSTDKGLWYSNYSYVDYRQRALDAVVRYAPKVTTKPQGLLPNPIQPLIPDTKILAWGTFHRSRLTYAVCDDCYADPFTNTLEPIKVRDVRDDFQLGSRQCAECGKSLRVILDRLTREAYSTQRSFGWGD